MIASHGGLRVFDAADYYVLSEDEVRAAFSGWARRLDGPADL